MQNYKIIVNDNLKLKILVKEPGILSIPFDEGNKDYQEYLKWVEEGNTAEEYNPGGIE